MNSSCSGTKRQGNKPAPGLWKQNSHLPARLILVLAAACLVLAGCAGNFDPLSWLQPVLATAAPSQAASPTIRVQATQLSSTAATSGAPNQTATRTGQSLGTPSSGATLPASSSTATRSTSTGSQLLLIWVPPQFDPANGTPAGEKMKARLASFENENPGIKVQVRVKAATGPGGLLESLTAASAAAPTTLPSLVALPRSDLEVAALKGLIFPIDGITHLIDDSDWYPFARQLALIQGSAFGLPFASDSLVLLYRPAKLTAAPTDWSGLLKAGQPISFPPADSQSILTLLLYLSAGGQVKDNQGRPILQAEPLTKVLKLYADGQKAGIFPNWIAQYQTDGQSWQAYREQRTNLLVTWSSRYLADLPADTSAAPIPSLGDQSMSMSTGWLWAVADPLSDRRSASVRLAEYLVNSGFMAQWSASAGYLPTRPSALSAWPNQSLRALLSPVLISSQIRPSNDLLLGIGPILQEATLQIIKQQSDPAQTAQAAAERLAIPTSK